MNETRRTLPGNVALACALLTFPLAEAEATDLYGSAPGKLLYRVDDQTGQTSLVGTMNVTDPNENEIYYLARGPSNELYGLSSGQFGPVITNVQSRIYRVDEQTATLTEILEIGMVHPAGAAIDPTDGSLFFIELSSGPWGPLGPENYLRRLDFGTGQIEARGKFGPFLGQFRDLTFDNSGQLYTIGLQTDSLFRVDKTDAAGAVSVGNGLGPGIDFSAGINLGLALVPGLAIGYEKANRRLFDVDLTTGLATYKVDVQPPEFHDLSGSGCTGSADDIGAGCPGLGGFIPALNVNGCTAVNQQISLQITEGKGGSTALLLFGLNPASVALGGNCVLHTWPLLPTVLALPLGGTLPGAGKVTLPTVIPPVASGATVILQAFVLDNTSPIGASGSNAVLLTVP